MLLALKCFSPTNFSRAFAWRFQSFSFLDKVFSIYCRSFETVDTRCLFGRLESDCLFGLFGSGLLALEEFSSSSSVSLISRREKSCPTSIMKDRLFRKWKTPRKLLLQKGFPQSDSILAKNWKDRIEASYIAKLKFTKRTMEPSGDMNPYEELDESVWSGGLPDDVLCTILACLPLSSFCRMRCVSKRWSLMAQDPVFLDACARVASREPSLLLKGTEGPYWAYEPGLNAWKYMPPTFLHPPNSQGTCSLVTVSGGRILFIMTSPLYSLMIFNPLNNSKRLLPPMFDMSQSYDLPTASEMHVVGMFFDSGNEYYNILVVDKRTNATVEDPSDSDDEFMLEPISSQVYDSRTSTWDLMESFEPEYELFILNAAVFNYSLRALIIAPKVSELFWSRPVVEELAIYKLTSDSWSHEAPLIPTHNQSVVAPHLFSCMGTLLLIAAVRCEENWTSIIIWELEMVGDVEDRWIKLVDIDLEDETDMLVDVNVDSFFFLSEGDLVYFGSDTGSMLGVINVLGHCWSFLPPFPGYAYDRPLPVGAVPDVRFQTFLYEPRFDVVV